MSWNIGATDVLLKGALAGSSSTMIIEICGFSAGKKPAKLFTTLPRTYPIPFSAFCDVPVLPATE